MDGCIEDACLGASVMLAYKYAHGIIKHPHIIEASALGAFALEMDDGGACKIIIPVSCFLDAVAEVHILAIHKEALIEAACFFQHIFPGHHESPCQHIHHMVFFRI